MQPRRRVHLYVIGREVVDMSIGLGLYATDRPRVIPTLLSQDIPRWQILRNPRGTMNEH